MQSTILGKSTLIKHATVVSDQSVQQPHDELVEIFANSLMTPLYADGLSDEFFLEMIGPSIEEIQKLLFE